MRNGKLYLPCMAAWKNPLEMREKLARMDGAYEYGES